MNTITIQAPNPDAFEYLIGYVEKFDFHDPDAKAIFNPHPIVGRVYQLLKDRSGYVIHIGELVKNTTLQGIFLGPELNMSDIKWDYNITVVNKENMLDLTITSEDLKKVGEWLDTKHKALKKSLSPKKKQAQSKVEELVPLNVQTILSEENKKFNTYNQLSADLSTLTTKDPEMLNAICVLVNYLSHKSPALTLRSYISSTDAPEAVIAAAISSLESYDVTMESLHILKTIETCLHEVQKYS